MLEFLFNKVAGVKACNFIKKRLHYTCFLVNFAKFLGAPTLNICEQLLLRNHEVNKVFESTVLGQLDAYYGYPYQVLAYGCFS